MRHSEYLKQLCDNFLKFLDANKISKVVIGLSGGVDSSVSLAILASCLKSQQILAYFIDIESSKVDYLDAKQLCKQFNINLNYVNLTRVYKKMTKEIDVRDFNAKGNLKSRLRMCTLYNYSFNNKAIVVGNANLDELYLGFFTKYGDSACDYFLLSGLLKQDIYFYANYFNLPKSIIEKKPSPGFDKNVFDVDELKVEYDVIDEYMKQKDVDQKTKRHLDKLHEKNKHKLIYNINANKSQKYRKILWKK